MRHCLLGFFGFLLTLGIFSSVHAGPILVVSPSSVVFPPVPGGEESNFVEVVLGNEGDQDISIDKISLTGNDPGDFSLATSCEGQILGPDQACSAYVALPAVFEGDYSALLEISSDAGTQVVPLSGTITAFDPDGCALGGAGPLRWGSVLGAWIFGLGLLFSLRISRKVL